MLDRFQSNISILNTTKHIYFPDQIMDLHNTSSTNRNSVKQIIRHNYTDESPQLITKGLAKIMDCQSGFNIIKQTIKMQNEELKT